MTPSTLKQLCADYCHTHHGIHHGPVYWVCRLVVRLLKGV